LWAGVGDSWFASFTTCVELLKRRLYFIGIVKTAHRLYPQKWLQKFSFDKESVRGATFTLNTTVEILDPSAAAGTPGETKRIMAHSWNEPKVAGTSATTTESTTANGKKKGKGRAATKEDKICKTFVSSAGLATKAEPWAKTRHYFIEPDIVGTRELLVEQSHIIRMYYQGANAIDVHNHLRQKSLGIEHEWSTKAWHFRVFQTLIGMMVTNAYLAFKYFRRSDEKLLSFVDFVNECAYFFCKGEELQPPVSHSGKKRSRGAKTGADEGPTAASYFTKRMPHCIELVDRENGKRQSGRCITCGASAYSHCPDCTAECGGKICYLCSSGVEGRFCGVNHPVEMHNYELKRLRNQLDLN
jgi:hypothetical protein